LPSTFRTGQVNFDSINKWFVDNNWGNLTKDSDELFIGVGAIEKAIEFLFEDQEDDDYEVDKETGFREKSLQSCNNCAQSTSMMYGCCDQIYSIEKSWFDIHRCYCENCRFFFLEGEEKVIDDILSRLLPRELVSIVKNYLPFNQSLFTMQKASSITCKKQRKMCIKPTITSVLTEWLPFFQYGESYDELAILFVNCNPESKFYSKTFIYNKDESLNLSFLFLIKLSVSLEKVYVRKCFRVNVKRETFNVNT
jgi:hypothetical protein